MPQIDLQNVLLQKYLACQGAEICRFLLFHFRKNILYDRVSLAKWQCSRMAAWQRTTVIARQHDSMKMYHRGSMAEQQLESMSSSVAAWQKSSVSMMVRTVNQFNVMPHCIILIYIMTCTIVSSHLVTYHAILYHVMSHYHLNCHLEIFLLCRDGKPDFPFFSGVFFGFFWVF